MNAGLKRSNVIFILADTLRAKEVFEKLNKLKFFKRMANEGITYRKAIAPSTWTLPSHASIFTGLLPLEHGVNFVYNRLKPSLMNLPVVFLKSGYSTACFTNNYLIDHFYGFGYGFERIFKILKTPEERLPFKSVSFYQISIDKTNFKNFSFKKIINTIYYYNLNYFGILQKDKGLSETITKMQNWISRCKNSFFIFTNLMETHEMYLPFSNHNLMTTAFHFSELIRYLLEVRIRHFTSRNLIESVNISDISARFLRRLYVSEIRYLDKGLKALYDFLEDKNVLDNTIIVMTSDHGQELYEHKSLGHPMRFYNTILHVPLFIRVPWLDKREIESFVSIKDVAKTITQLALGPQKASVISGKLLPPFGKNTNFSLSETLGDPVFEMKLRNPENSNELDGIPIDTLKEHFIGGVSVYFNKYHYIKYTDGRKLLFDFEKDYLEQNNIIGSSISKEEFIPKDIMKFADFRLEKIRIKNASKLFHKFRRSV